MCGWRIVTSILRSERNVVDISRSCSHIKELHMGDRSKWLDWDEKDIIIIVSDKITGMDQKDDHSVR